MTGRMLDVEGFILVGGMSSRMGRDKSQLRLGGMTLVERIKTQLSPVTKRVRLVGGHPDDHEGSLRHIPDVHPSWGPLGGIHAALGAALSLWCILVACDLPFVTGELFERLLQLASESGNAFDAIVPLQNDNRPQALCGIYRTISCFHAATEAIQRGEHTPRAWLDTVNTRWVPFSAFCDLEGAEHFFFNLNTPESYERAIEIELSRRRESQA